jgi:hypothetical protein
MKDLIRALYVSPTIEYDTMRSEMAKNTRVSKIELTAIGSREKVATLVLMHLRVVPMCMALVPNGGKMQSPNNKTSREPKKAVMILLLQ